MAHCYSLTRKVPQALSRSAAGGQKAKNTVSRQSPAISPIQKLIEDSPRVRTENDRLVRIFGSPIQLYPDNNFAHDASKNNEANAARWKTWACAWVDKAAGKGAFSDLDAEAYKDLIISRYKGYLTQIRQVGRHDPNTTITLEKDVWELQEAFGVPLADATVLDVLQERLENSEALFEGGRRSGEF